MYINKRAKIRNFLKIASRKDFDEIKDKTLLTPLQRDIISLMFEGYDPVKFADNQYLKGKKLRKGERLTREETADALNVSEGTITNENNKIFRKIEQAGILELRDDDASTRI